MNRVKTAPAAGGVVTGLVASLCCGGSLILASVGLGTFWSALRMSRYIPQVLAAGALCIIAINYVFYCRAAKRICGGGGDGLRKLRRSVFLSASLGLAAMAGSFIFIEWLNHAVINPGRFAEYAHALIPGVPDERLLYALASFAALAVLWVLPFPQRGTGVDGPSRALQWGVFAATAAMVVFLAISAMRVEGKSGLTGEQPSLVHQHQR